MRRDAARTVVAVHQVGQRTPGRSSARRAHRACTAPSPRRCPAPASSDARWRGPSCTSGRSAAPSSGPAGRSPGRSTASRASLCASLNAIRSASANAPGAFGPSAGEVGVQVRLELVEQHLELAVAHLRRRRAVPPGRRSRRRAASCTSIAASATRSAVRRSSPKQALRGTPMRAPSSAVRVEEPRVVAHRLAVAAACRPRSRGVGPDERAEQDRRIGHRARHRPGRVLAVRDRDDARRG